MLFLPTCNRLVAYMAITSRFPSTIPSHMWDFVCLCPVSVSVSVSFSVSRSPTVNLFFVFLLPYPSPLNDELGPTDRVAGSSKPAQRTGRAKEKIK